MTIQSRPPCLADVTAPILARETADDLPAVDRLIDAAFGPGRYTKISERLRETNRVLADLSFTARAGGALVGCVRLWPIRIGPDPVVFLGPIAVDSAWRGHGLGGALIERACAAAAEAGHSLVLLVGDEPFFGPHGFVVAPPGRWIMPGPVDPRRLLARALIPGRLEAFCGAVTPGW